MTLTEVINRCPTPTPWDEGEKIPWDERCTSICPKLILASLTPNIRNCSLLWRGKERGESGTALCV